jgi:dCMP deaminase
MLKVPDNVYDNMYMDIADHIGQTLSFDQNRKVGAIAVRDGSILGYGINGTPSGWPTNEVPTDYNGRTIHENVVHAEINLIAKMARKGFATEGATLYCNYAPCAECAKAIRQAGFKRVVYLHPYKNDEGLNVLTRGIHSTVIVEKI